MVWPIDAAETKRLKPKVVYKAPQRVRPLVYAIYDPSNGQWTMVYQYVNRPGETLAEIEALMVD